MDDVVVLGAGVIGLTTAIRCTEAGYRVRVWAAEGPERTTSRVAGAIWKPYLSDGPNLLEWAAVTFGELADDAGHEERGVRLRRLLEAMPVPFAVPAWAAVAGATRLGEDELPPGWKGGFACRVPVVDMGRYLPYLVGRLLDAGVVVEEHPIDSWADLGDRPVVVNCTGLGSRRLAGDAEVYPVRGQVVVVANPGVVASLGDTGPGGTGTYVIAHDETVVVGGTADPHEWDLAPDPATAAAMLSRAARLVPALEGAEVIADRVGLRPWRPTVRLGLDPRPPAGIGRLVHNYGHGGSGVTLSWGCAAAACRCVAAG